MLLILLNFEKPIESKNAATYRYDKKLCYIYKKEKKLCQVHKKYWKVMLL